MAERMPELALVDRRRYALATSARRIPRRAWAQLGEVEALLRAAEMLSLQAQSDAESLRARAAEEGRAAGRAAAAADVAELFVQAQADVRSFVAAADAHLAALALAVVERVLPQLADTQRITALIDEAVRAADAERYLRVRVHPRALERAQERLPRWREHHPQLAQLQLLADPELPEHGCVVETEAGVLHAGLQDRFDAVRAALLRAAAGD